MRLLALLFDVMNRLRRPDQFHRPVGRFRQLREMLLGRVFYATEVDISRQCQNRAVRVVSFFPLFPAGFERQFFQIARIPHRVSSQRKRQKTLAQFHQQHLTRIIL